MEAKMLFSCQNMKKKIPRRALGIFFRILKIIENALVLATNLWNITYWLIKISLFEIFDGKLKKAHEKRIVFLAWQRFRIQLATTNSATKKKEFKPLNNASASIQNGLIGLVSPFVSSILAKRYTFGSVQIRILNFICRINLCHSEFWGDRLKLSDAYSTPPEILGMGKN